MTKKLMQWVAVLAAALAVLSTPALALGPNGTSGSITAVNANVSSGTATAGSSVVATLFNGAPGSTIFSGSDAKYATVGIQVLGTWAGTLTFQYSQDEGVTWISLPVYPTPVTGVAPASTTTANGNWLALTSGYTHLRVTCTTYTSGTANVSLEQYMAPFSFIPLADAASRLITGNSGRATYDASNTVTVPTAASSMFAIESSATALTRLRRIKVCLTTGLQTTAGERQLALFATTAASTGGSTQTPTQMDASDAAFGGIVRAGALTTTPAVGAVTLAANALWSEVIFMPAAATTAVPCVSRDFDLSQMKALTAAAGVAKGLALADLTGGSGGTGNYAIDLTFTSEAN